MNFETKENEEKRKMALSFFLSFFRSFVRSFVRTIKIIFGILSSANCSVTIRLFYFFKISPFRMMTNGPKV